VFRITSALTPVALVLVAWATYGLHQSISRLETSVALYQEFVSSEPIKSLQELSFQGFHRIWEAGEEGVLQQLPILVDRIKRRPLQTRRQVSEFLEQVVLVYFCYEKGLCGFQSVENFFGAPVLNLFFGIGPLIYCDAYVRTWYAERHFEKMETLIALFILEDNYSFGVEKPLIFRNRENLKKALKEKRITKKDADQAVIMAIGENSQICMRYRSLLARPIHLRNFVDV